MNPKELELIEQRLLRERERTLRALGRLRQEAADSADSLRRHPSSNHAADGASDWMEREKVFLLGSREERYLHRVEDALRRLYQEPDAFGRCHGCGREIPFTRLEIVPYARFCLDCKLRDEAA